MPMILQDTVHFVPPARIPILPAAPLDPVTLAEERLVSFELEWPGGYPCTTTDGGAWRPRGRST